MLEDDLLEQAAGGVRGRAEDPTEPTEPPMDPEEEQVNPARFFANDLTLSGFQKPGPVIVKNPGFSGKL